MTDDAGGDPGGPVEPGSAHRRDAARELDLADGPHFGRDVGAVHRGAFDVDGGDDIVAAGEVGQQIVQ